MSENQPSARGAKPLFALLLGLILFLFGVAAGYTLSGSKSAAPGGKGFEEGYEAAKTEYQELLEASGLIQSEEDVARLEAEPVHSLGGTVMSVSGNTLTFEAAIPTFSPLEESITKTYTARITDATSLVKQSEMTMEEQDMAFEKFNEAQLAYDRETTAAFEDPDFDGEFPEAPQPPDIFMTTDVDLDSFTAGMSVLVSSEEDLKQALSFEATSISFFESNIDLALPSDLPTPEEDLLP